MNIATIPCEYYERTSLLEFSVSNSVQALGVMSDVRRYSKKMRPLKFH